MKNDINYKKLAHAIVEYELAHDNLRKVSQYTYCMDVQHLPERPDIPCFPDYANEFTSLVSAIEYVCEENRPIWFVSIMNKFPVDFWNLDKLQFLFPEFFE